KSLEGQGRDGEAKALDGKLEAAWIDADVTPQSSCYCEPGLETAP
ncbi:MAG: hypothetical protein ACI9C2_001509, partial [Gammaproteobacteria bacterium]